MSSFLFLTFCVYVFCCLGLHFSAVPLSNPFFRWLLPVPYKPPQEPYTPPTGPVLCSASVVPYPVPKTAHRAAQGEFVFSPQNGLTPPPKGGGSGYHLSWVVGFALLVHNWPTRLQQGGFAASLVSFSQPRPLTGHISPHRGEFGFGLLAGASKEDHPPFRQSRVRNRAEEKTPLPCFSKIEPVKFVIPCKRFFKPSGVKSFSLFMRRKFCGGIPVRKELSRLTFSPYKAANPACPGPGSYHLNLWRGRLTPPCLAPICTPRPRG